MTLGRTLLSMLCLVLMVGCGSSSPAQDNNVAMANDPSSRPGSAAVYARIETETNCVKLQREFDVAMSNVEAREPGDEMRTISESYGEAANNRMREVGCYG